ncbi:hypothetical protein LguiA_016185 [Lonicera macranthoides]
MNVVGRVGSFITQGVYSVATPFHPFGGAVDMIVVQQQDGSFRSTPWYVRFGKFQGVLKGAEKIVRIEVNGIEADFHMYLDNSGEAYFIREVTNGKEKDSDSLEGIREDNSTDYNNNDDNREDSVSNTGEVYLQDEHVSLGVNRLERTQSEITDHRFYEFQDEQSSLDGSVELSDYGSSHYENLDNVDNMMESENSNSEVILVSVDGHMLTAPILSSEGNNAEDVQLSIPQFHLGPGEETDFCEGNPEFGTGEASWPEEYSSNLGTSRAKVISENIPEHHSEVSEGNGKNVCQVQENQDVANQGSDQLSESPKGVDGAFSRVKREDIFKSCLELQELASQVGSSNQQEIDFPMKSRADSEDTQEKSPHCLLEAGEAEDGSIGVSENRDGLSPTDIDSPNSKISPDLQVEAELNVTNTLGTDQNISVGIDVHSVSGGKEPEDRIGIEDVKNSLLGPTSDGKTDSKTRFEISLCGDLLCAGMGLSAAAEAFNAHRISEEEFKLSAASIIKNEKLVVKFQEMYLPWEKAAHIVLGMAVYGLDLPVDPNDAIRVEPDEAPKLREDDSGITSSPSARRWRLWPIPFRRVKTLEHTNSNLSEDLFVDSEPSPTFRGKSESPHKQLLRTNVPTTEQIASLNLNEGQNLITFSFCTRVLGMQKVEAHIYLWKWNARIVISDVDGTITKSDVLGQFMPLVGKDWTQSGVARLFSAIKENGYQLLFLSARAIVQAYLTRSFLVNLKQDGKALPLGPVVISPDGLFPSLYREVIRRAPHEFKIACLEDIKALFPADYNPFYAGFGNRDTDELSYRKIGIPKGKIFIINPKGEVAISHCIDAKSYTSLHTLVNDMFPPTSMVEQEDYNSWNYWRVPLPDIDNL